MALNIDFNLYQSIRHDLPLTEKIVGITRYAWKLSEIHYAAECTVGVPFDLFDKTIIGILQVDEKLSLEEIGTILGMNLIQDAEMHRYRDQAEYDILRVALDNLERYGMIDVGDIEYSQCSITETGKEYARKGRKFRIEQNRSFVLHFDHTSGRHIEAKDLFKGLSGESRNSLPADFDFLNEQLLKSIADKQVPDIYNEETGNSFKAPQIKPALSKTTDIQIDVAIIYDLEKRSTRLLAFDSIKGATHTYITEWLNGQEKEGVLARYFQETASQPSQGTLSSDFATLLNEAAQKLEAETTDPAEALEIVHQTYKALRHFDLPYFWTELDRFVSTDTKELWFFLPEISKQLIQFLIAFVERNKSIPVLITLKENDYPPEVRSQIDRLKGICIGITNSSCFLEAPFKTINSFSFWSISRDTKNSYELVHRRMRSEPDGSIFLNTLNLIPLATDAVYTTRKRFIASTLLPFIEDQIEKLAISLTERIDEVDLLTIDGFRRCDQKTACFADLAHLSEISKHLRSIEALKERTLRSLTERHKQIIERQLATLRTSFSQKEIEKVEELEPYNQGIARIKSEISSDYDDMIRSTESFERVINERKKHLIDEKLSRVYIIDTNVFVLEPEVIEKINPKHTIVLTHTVIAELDRLKSRTQGQAEKALKLLNRKMGYLKNLKQAKPNLSFLPEDYRANEPDNRILSVAFFYRDKNPILLTNDNGLQLKSKTIGIPTLSLSELNRELEREERQSSDKKLPDLDFEGVYRRLRPEKRTGRKEVGTFVHLLRKQYPGFDFRQLGFADSESFVASIPGFAVQEGKFIHQIKK